MCAHTRREFSLARQQLWDILVFTRARHRAEHTTQDETLTLSAVVIAVAIPVVVVLVVVVVLFVLGELSHSEEMEQRKSDEEQIA